MQKITLPEKPVMVKKEGNYAMFEIRACYPGYGMTFGNALRRVLLSSLQGAAITLVKIEGVSHEFSTIPGILEDVVELTLNLKRIRFKMHSDEPVTLNLKANKEGTITAGDFATVDNVEVVNPEAHIATLTKNKGAFEMYVTVEKGVGYLPVEQQEKEKKEIGTIGMDAIFTPIKSVNYKVEHMRVGKMTNYDKLTLEIETDGSRTPEEAFRESVELLVRQFDLFREVEEQLETEKNTMNEFFVSEAEADENATDSKSARVTSSKDSEVERLEAIAEEKEQDALQTELNQFKISVRVLKVLEENGVKNVADLVERSEEEILAFSGMGDKGVKEIKKAIGKLGLTLRK